MKQFFFFVVCMFYCLFIVAQEPSGIFIPNKRIHDFGDIFEKKGKVSYSFQFYNKGNKPIVIDHISAWCGCTSLSYTKRPILPKQKGIVTVTYNPYNRPGAFSKEIVVLTESGKSYSRVWIKGNVIPYLHPVTEDYPYSFGAGLYLGFKVLAFGKVQKGEQKTMEIGYANDTDSLMTLAFKREPDDYYLKIPTSLTLRPKERSKMTFSYIAPNNYAFDRLIKVYPIVNGICLTTPLLVTFTK